MKCVQTAYWVGRGISNRLNIADNSIFIEDATTDWAQDYNNMLNDKLAQLKIDSWKADRYKQVVGGSFRKQRNMTFDYSKDPIFQRTKFESSQDIHKRYDLLTSKISELAFREQKRHVYVLVGHESYFSWLSKQINKTVEK